jgi:cytochrome c biogenesis protein
MPDTTPSLVPSMGSRIGHSLHELLASMRFSISLLTIICIASVIGTVLKQREPLNNYVNQFGPFWADLFATLGLYNVYSAWWFLLILAFLVVSTSLCVARNTPKILSDLKNYKENIRAQSLQAFGHRAQTDLSETPQQAAQRMGGMLSSSGWKVKLQQRDTPQGTGWMVAAKAGAANKLGYIAAHTSIVLICIGGLLDGDMVVRAQMLLNDKQTYNGGGLISEVPAQHRLSESNPTFRGNLLVAEGTQSSTAILNQADGILLQELPFAIELKKFIVEYYSTGMPKLFASEVVIHDKVTGDTVPARIEVNRPASYRGIEIYQSSFDDGGSQIKLRAQPMDGSEATFGLEGVVGSSQPLTRGAEQLTVEFTGLRVINVENFANTEGLGVDVRKVDLRQAVEQRLGAANKVVTQKELRNIGPSVSYKLRDAAGQAREYNNYMVPVNMDEGVPVFLFGVRDTPAESFRYLRIPADSDASMGDFLRLRQALYHPATMQRAVEKYASQVVEPGRPELTTQLQESALRALRLFGGVTVEGQPQTVLGLQAIADFIEANVPESERSKAGEMLVRILNGSLFELLQVARAQDGLAALPLNEQTRNFMTQSVLALSDVTLYPAPFVLQLDDFTHVQASVFQVARAPGKTIVYLGCAFLIVGIFAMLYVRERRLWIWLAPLPDAAHAHASMALSTNRKTMDADHEFDLLKLRLLGLKDTT